MHHAPSFGGVMRTLLLISIYLFFVSCIQAQGESVKMKSASERYSLGLKNLDAIDKEAGARVIESLQNVSPDLGKLLIEYVFGEIYNRKGLDIKSKELAVVAALTAMGNANPQLRVHINAALNVGCNIAQVQEVILQMSAYSGFPSSINGMIALKDVLEERKAEGKKDEKGVVQPSEIPESKTRYEFGADQLRQLNKNQVEVLEETFKEIAPDMAKFIIEYGFADILARPALNFRYREIATIAALAAVGNASSQLKFHIRAALNIGVTQEEIREIMLLMSVYSGFPAAINGTLALKEIANEGQ
jgi:4-carboxymuconolactone decarboxylase